MHNLKNIDVDVPLNKIVGIAGVSGSGKSSLALGVFIRRGFQALSGLAFDIHKTADDSGRESRGGRSPVRSRGARASPKAGGSLDPQYFRNRNRTSKQSQADVFQTRKSPLSERALSKTDALRRGGRELVCEECGVRFYAPSAEELAFNSQGACEKCGGTGTVRTVDKTTLVPDESLSIDEGAVAPWNSLMWSLMTDVCREMGVRTDVPFRELTEKERDIVFSGPPRRNIFSINQKTPIKRASSTSPISTRYTPSRTRWRKSRTKRA